MATTPNMSLTTWPNLTDVFDHTALAGNFTALDQHDHTTGKGVPVGVGGIANLAVGTAQLQDGSVVPSKIADSGVIAQKIAASAVTSVKLDPATIGLRSKSIIASTNTRTNVAYATMASPDQVPNIVLSSDGLIAVAYQATWQETNAGAARAAVFLNKGAGDNQLQIASFGIGGPVTQAAATGAGSVNTDHPLVSTHTGLVSADTSAYPGDATTGQIVGMVGSSLPDLHMEIGSSVVAVSAYQGGFFLVFAAAGTYTVSVQFRATAGTVTVKNRKLWVEALAF